MKPLEQIPPYGAWLTSSFKSFRKPQYLPPHLLAEHETLEGLERELMLGAGALTRLQAKCSHAAHRFQWARFCAEVSEATLCDRLHKAAWNMPAPEPAVLGPPHSHSAELDELRCHQAWLKLELASLRGSGRQQELELSKFDPTQPRPCQPEAQSSEPPILHAARTAEELRRLQMQLAALDTEADEAEARAVQALETQAAEQERGEKATAAALARACQQTAAACDAGRRAVGSLEAALAARDQVQGAKRAQAQSMEAAGEVARLEASLKAAATRIASQQAVLSELETEAQAAQMQAAAHDMAGAELLEELAQERKRTAAARDSALLAQRSQPVQEGTTGLAGLAMFVDSGPRCQQNYTGIHVASPAAGRVRTYDPWLSVLRAGAGSRLRS